MPDVFRIHGDNIVECERIVKIILGEVNPTSTQISLIAPSTIAYNIQFNYLQQDFDWQLELLPGFNKAGRIRWEADIFTGLRNSGSFLDETPDIIVTRVDNNLETIIYAIEFCSALQAGNQAWQRSGRAFSTGRANCPYLYVTELGSFELNSKTRERESLRLPNPIVPYSYINYSRYTHNFIAQLYTRSPEFNKEWAKGPDKKQGKKHRNKLSNFDESNFAETELLHYIVKRMCGFDTSEEEERIRQKSLNIVKFLANCFRQSTNLTCDEWQKLLDEDKQDIVEYSLNTNERFRFRKKLLKSHDRPVIFRNNVEELSVGLASRDLPFGIIPANKRKQLAKKIKELYPTYTDEILNKIASDQADLILCMIKGSKPKAEDGRPDRGVLPLITMFSSANVEVMTYIYGPVRKCHFDALQKDSESRKSLAETNGFWRSILAFSNYVALDVPVYTPPSEDPVYSVDLINTSTLKESYFNNRPVKDNLTQNVFLSTPNSFHEDDVDTGIHFLFSHMLKNACFEGMCNPPGGDWSGLSLICGTHEKRWLSLPRDSKAIDGKRPDHVLELFDVYKRPVLLSIESKEQASLLEKNVGTSLVNYIRTLMNFIPSVERSIQPNTGEWIHSTTKEKFSSFISISAAAYLRKGTKKNEDIFKKTQCDMLFIMEPVKQGWQIEISANTKHAKKLKKFICKRVAASGIKGITIIETTS